MEINRVEIVRLATALYWKPRQTIHASSKECFVNFVVSLCRCKTKKLSSCKHTHLSKLWEWMQENSEAPKLSTSMLYVIKKKWMLNIFQQINNSNSGQDRYKIYQILKSRQGRALITCDKGNKTWTPYPSRLSSRLHFKNSDKEVECNLRAALSLMEGEKTEVILEAVRNQNFRGTYWIWRSPRNLLRCPLEVFTKY